MKHKILFALVVALIMLPYAVFFYFVQAHKMG